MSVFYIVGKPGSGKSYAGVRHMLLELLDEKSNRPIVTNLPLLFDDREEVKEVYPIWAVGPLKYFATPRIEKRIKMGLVSYLHKNVKHEINLSERIRILDDMETAEFYLYAPHEKYEKRKEWEYTVGAKRRKFNVPDFTDRTGVLYIIDEVHLFFGAREWQETGTDMMYFLSQHRKLNCDVILITQHPEQCDKALRRLAQEYMTMRNLNREPIFGFRISNYFRYIRSLNAPNSGNPAIFETGFMRFSEREVGDMYDTTAGVGIQGRLVPKQEKRGIHWGWVTLPALVWVIFLLYVFTHLHQIANFISNSFNHGFYHVATNVQDRVKAGFHVTNSPSAFNTVLKPFTQSFKPVQAGSQSVDEVNGSTVLSEETVCTGYCILNGNTFAFLSDGRTATSQDGTLLWMTKLKVKCFGEVYDIDSESQLLKKGLLKPYVEHSVLPVNEARIGNLTYPNSFNNTVSVLPNHTTTERLHNMASAPSLEWSHEGNNGSAYP